MLATASWTALLVLVCDVNGDGSDAGAASDEGVSALREREG
jgi:hypothetical protein